jgi:acetyl-CoA carboxylase biotin carboxyl carrier protein
MIMDTKNIEKLIQLIETAKENLDVQEIEVKNKDGSSLRVALQPSGQAHTTTQPPSASHTPATQPETLFEGFQVKSPMVGTVYLTPSPEAEAFVQVGQSVTVGQTLCLIEAMKMFNKIKAEKSGIVTNILVENGQPIEFDQTLIVIKD